MPDHYLISMHAGSMIVHGYLMSNDKSVIDGAMNQVADCAEEIAGRSVPPLILLTGPLDEQGIEIVRSILNVHYKAAIKMMADATDFHFSCWGMPINDEACQQLMAIH
jgi:hypothetical protein